MPGRHVRSGKIPRRQSLQILFGFRQGHLGRRIGLPGYGSDVYRRDGARPCGARAVGSGAASSSSCQPSECGSCTSRFACARLGAWTRRRATTGATPSQIQPQPCAALWSTIPILAIQVGGPATAVAVPNPAEAARAALFMSQLAGMQAATQAAVLPQPTTPPPTPAYVAPRAEEAPARQPRSTAQATAALTRNELWIPYSTSTLGSHSPYPHIRPPGMCFECNTPRLLALCLRSSWASE